MSKGEACMDSDSQVSSLFYPVELNKATECPFEKTTSETFDPRYKSVASEGQFTYGEWDIMKENNVRDILMALPSYLFSLNGQNPDLKN